jgi:glutathione S-transferase
MADLFHYGSAAKALDADDRYGSDGDMKKTQYVMQLLGFPGDVDTLKCLLTAAEKGIEVESGVLDMTKGEQDSDDFRAISPFGITPALKEAQYVVVGEPGCAVFIEGRGLGNRLAPRNAAVLATEMEWMEVGKTEVQPHVEALMMQKVCGKMADPSFVTDDAAVQAARAALADPLDAFDDQLQSNEFVVGQYSYADIHWTIYVHLLTVMGEGALYAKHNNIKAWFERVKAHKSFSGQDIISYDFLPTLEEIQAKVMKDVECGEF